MEEISYTAIGLIFLAFFSIVSIGVLGHNVLVIRSNIDSVDTEVEIISNSTLTSLDLLKKEIQTLQAQLQEYHETINSLNQEISNKTLKIDELSTEISNLENQLKTIENSTKSQPEIIIIFKETLKFDGNKSILLSLQKNITIKFTFIAQSGIANFTFGLLQEEPFENMMYVTDRIPEYQLVIHQTLDISRIEFTFTTYIEGLYGFSFSTKTLSVFDITIEKTQI